MLRISTLAAVGLAALAAACADQTAQTRAPNVAETSSVAPKRVDNFRLVDHTGRAKELYRYRDAPAVVIITHKAGDAQMARLAPAIEALRAAYAPKGVELMMLNSSLDDTREEIVADAKALKVKMPIVHDDVQLAGEQLGVERAGEVFVVDPKSWNIVYRGALSGEFAAKAGADAAPHAAQAIDALIAGDAAPRAQVAAAGTPIAFPNRTPAAIASHQLISYTDTIAPIIEAKCVDCHQQGGIAPFAMDRYETVKGFAPMIREVIRTDRMPPWDVDPHVGTFKDDKSLSADQIRTLVHWIEAGAPRGAGEDPLAKVKHVAPEWPLGEPDLIVDIPTYTVPASGVVDYQYPVVENPLKEGRWLKASTARVSQRQAVHHILSGFIRPGQEDLGMESWGSSVGGYTVGMESVVQPNGIGTYLPGGGKFAFQMHYTPYGREAVSAEKIGLYFYKDGEKPDLMMREQPLVDQFIKIPANEGSHEETAYFLFPKDAILHTAVVHAHYRGTYSNLKIVYPDGKEKMIVNVPFYDFNWQRMYEFAEPIRIPAGSKVVATYIYDNSSRNPANPDPSKEITWGDQSFEEMFYTSLRYRWVDETVENETNYDELLLRTRLLGMMDDDLDNKVQEAELAGFFADALKGRFQLADQNKDGGLDQAEIEQVLSVLRSMRRGGGQQQGG